MLYDAGTFSEISVKEDEDPELAEFVKQTLTRGPKFSNYTPEKIQYFVDRIYELRKN